MYVNVFALQVLIYLLLNAFFFLSFQRVFLRLLLSLKSQSTEEVDLFFSWVGAEHGWAVAMGLTGNNLFERTDKFCNNFLFDIRDGVVGVSGLGQKMLEFCGMLSDLLKEFWVEENEPECEWCDAESGVVIELEVL